MEITEDSGVMQKRIYDSSSGTSSSSLPNQQNQQFDSPIFTTPRLEPPIMPQFSQLAGSQSGKKNGMPPSHPHFPPYSMTTNHSQQMNSYNLSPRGGASHSRSLSQPKFFSLDSLPPFSPLPYCEPSSSESVLNDMCMEERNCNSNAAVASGNAIKVNDGLPPRRGHRRSSSDVPLGFNAMIQSPHQLIPRRNPGISPPTQLVKRESEWNKIGDNGNAEKGVCEGKSEGDVVDELFRTYMNLDNMDTLTSSATEDKDMESSRKTNGGESSDNEVESNIKSFCFTNEKKEGLKRSAGGDIAPPSRHYRSISMDSFMGNFNFGDESPKIIPAMGNSVNQLSPSNSIDGSSSKFNMDLCNGEFSGAELKKIMVNEKLSEIALSDPKRAKRILANRQSAARSKERKVRYMSELEHKVQTLQAEATTLSAQVTVLQRDSAELTGQNNEMKFRLQAIEQQAQLRDALYETLTAEVQRLKLAAAELRGETHLSNSMFQQRSFDRPQFQTQQQQSTQRNIFQLQQYHLQQQQNQKLPLENVEAAKEYK